MVVLLFSSLKIHSNLLQASAFMAVAKRPFIRNPQSYNQRQVTGSAQYSTSAFRSKYSPGRRSSATSHDNRVPKLYIRANRKPDEFRADRVLANRSGKPRSECFDLLQKRRVFYQEDSTEPEKPPIWKAVPGPKHKLPMSAPLKVDATTIPLPPPLLLAYHKPKWVLSVRNDPKYARPCLDASTLTSTHPLRIADPASAQWNDVDSINSLVDAVLQLHPVGRLDYDSSGLLLFSSDGALTQHLLHPKHTITKEYTAIVTGHVHEEQLREQLTAGVATAEGVHTAELIRCHVWDPLDVPSYLKQVTAGLPREYNQTDLQLRGYMDVLQAHELSSVTLQVAEGKHRMVRRVLANVGHPVVDLRRNRMGIIELGDLPVGSVRALQHDELAWASNLLKGKK